MQIQVHIWQKEWKKFQDGYEVSFNFVDAANSIIVIMELDEVAISDDGRKVRLLSPTRR